LEETNRVVVSPMYDRAVRQSLGMQVALGVLAALTLDGGVMAYVLGVALLGFWISVALLMIRRPMQPTRFDLAFIRWGFLPIWFVAVLVQISS